MKIELRHLYYFYCCCQRALSYMPVTIHPACQQNEATPENLGKSKLFLPPRAVDPSFHDTVVRNLRNAGFKVSISYAATSAQAQHSLVAANMGICLTLATSPLTGALKALPINPNILFHDLTLA